jgi:outer membrane protein assembly factor BamA
LFKLHAAYAAKGNVMKQSFFVHVAMMAVLCAVGARPALAQNTTEDKPGVFSRTFSWVTEKMVDGAGQDKDGLYPELGGLIPGAGLAVGPGYRQHLFGDSAMVSASATISARRYSMMQSRIEWPSLFSNRLSLGVSGKYQDFTQINYFGVGPETDKSAWSNYRLKGVDLAGSAAVRPVYWLSIGGSAGYIRNVDILRGLSSTHPSTGDSFDENTAPGLTVQPRYGHANVFVEADTRNVQGYATNGGVYRIGMTAFHDVDGSGQSFRRVEADATQYVPVIRKNWILAVRGQAALSQTGAGNTVPFYMMPTLGGRTTLPGYNDYRFRDRNAASIGAEYRIPVFGMVDAAVFGDAGRVAPTARGLWEGRLVHDYGVGLRLHSTTRSLARLDVARGREGMRFSVGLTKFLGASRNNVIPYVP